MFDFSERLVIMYLKLNANSLTETRNRAYTDFEQNIILKHKQAASIEM